MNKLQYLAFRLLLDKLAEQQTEANSIKRIASKWEQSGSQMVELKHEDRQAYREAHDQYVAVTREINDITEALNDSM